MMKLSSRPVHATMLTLFLLASHHRFQLSDCAKPSSIFPREKADDDDDDAHLPSTMVGDVVVVGSSRTNDDDDDAAGGLAAPSSSDTTPPVQGKEEEGVGSAPPWQQQITTGALRRWAALLPLPPPSRPWLPLPRRFLAAGVESSGTDGAGPSCHSNDARISCPPPPSKP